MPEGYEIHMLIQTNKRSNMFTVTKDWLDSNKTKAGGYTKKQLEAISVGFPPAKGWKKIAIGLLITDEQKSAFELKQQKDSNKLLNAKRVVFALNESDRLELVQYIKQITR